MKSPIDQFLHKTLVKHPAAGEETAKKVAFPIYTPTMTMELFAEVSGIPSGVLRGQVERGYIPSKVFGRRRYINVALLNAQLLQQQEKHDPS